MNKFAKIFAVLLVCTSLIVATGCQKEMEELQGDVEKAAENLKEEAEKVGTGIMETKEYIEDKAEKVGNAVDAIKEVTE